MLDRYNRKINYLRISVTDRCNLRCNYCMPENDPCLLSHDDILTFEEIQQVVAVAVPLGIDKIRLTGGEPLVRRDIINLVSMISAVPGLKDLGMTTNGILLDKYAKRLSAAGLKRVNISLDTVNPEKFREITRGGDINKVFRGISAAKEAGLLPVKVNCVIDSSTGEEDAMAVGTYCRENDLDIRYIPKMDLETGKFGIVHGGTGGNCIQCNRLRLTSDGKVKPCLFSDLAFDIREFGIQEAIEQALLSKPEKGSINLSNLFHNIGG